MEQLDILRKEIDNIDDTILDLLNKRAKLVIEIGNIKKARNAPLYVPSRERAIYERLKAKNEGPFPNDALRNVFREIISASLSLEEVQKVAYLGPQGTFTHLAAVKHFGLSAKPVACRSIPEVFEDVEKKRCDYGVVPIENSLEGVVNHTLDMFSQSNLKICGEIFLEVSHHLMNLTGKIEDVKRVYSHPHAIAQCRKWITANIPNIPIVEVESTAKAAELATKDESIAAISSEMAEMQYNLKIIYRNIEDMANNYTRFLVIGYMEPEPTENDKTSILFGVAHKAGSLFKALQVFADNGINMSKIESRPSKMKAWEYIFYVDIDGHIKNDIIRSALDKFAEHVSFMRVLGSYPKGVK